MKYLKKDGTLCSKVKGLILSLSNKQYQKLSNFYQGRTTHYNSMLDTDLFEINREKEEIVKNGFNPLVKAIVKINLFNPYVIKELEVIRKAREEAEENEAARQFEFNLMKQDAMIFLQDEKMQGIIDKHIQNSKGLQDAAWKLSNIARKKGINISKTAMYHVISKNLT